MFKTIFSKMISVFIIIFIVAFTITGFMLSYFLNGYITDERAQLLESTSVKVNDVFNVFLGNMDPSNVLYNRIVEKYLTDMLTLFGNYTNSLIWIVDDSGYIFRSNIAMPQQIVDKYADSTGYIKIPEEKQFSKLISEETSVSSIGDFNGFFKNSSFQEAGDLWLTVGRSFKYEHTSGDNFMVIIYLHTPVNELKQARYAVFKYFLISAGAAVVIAFVLVYIFSLRLSNPLKQIKNAAGRIANGEFEKRLSIKSKDEIGELAKTFNQMALALQNIEEMRRGFIANVSHELRTPMTSIRGFIEGILDGTIPSENHRHYLSIVRDETNRLNRLVNDLLDLAKMESGEMELNVTDFNINELVRQCVIKLETLLIEKGLTVDADFEEDSILVTADRDAIERVLYNLIHNAIKFTPEGGNIKLTTRKQKGVVNVTVKDNGIGIDVDQIDMIWDRFYKTDKSRSRDKTGTGLGLAIVRNIINEHGQKIWINSKVGEGTAFCFTLQEAVNKAGE